MRIPWFSKKNHQLVQNQTIRPIEALGRWAVCDVPDQDDPALMQASHESFPDGVLVTLHDGEPRRTAIAPEHCWVRVSGSFEGPLRRFLTNPEGVAGTGTNVLTNTIYTGMLQNQPHHLTTIAQGDTVQFLADSGTGKALMVTDDYLEERATWRVMPCNQCGFAKGYDAPSIMHQCTRTL